MLPETPAKPRDNPASMMPAANPDARIASAIPRTKRSRMSSVASGVTSRGRDPGAAHRDDQVHSADHRGVERVADLHFIGGDGHHAVDDEPGFGEQLGDQRAAVVLVPVTVRSSTTTTSALPTNSAPCSMGATVYLGSDPGAAALITVGPCLT